MSFWQHLCFKKCTFMLGFHHQSYESNEPARRQEIFLGGCFAWKCSHLLQLHELQTADCLMLFPVLYMIILHKANTL